MAQDARTSLLSAQDPAPFRSLNPDSDIPLILLCDHAGAAVPSTLDMGLTPEDLTRHYAYDIGICAVAEKLATLLGVPCLIGTYSRLVVDLNRGRDHETCVPTSAEGKPVDCNIALTAEAREARLRAIYDPYHNALAGMIATFRERNRVPLLVSLHSFTPVFFGEARPWHMSALWIQDDRLAHRFVDHFTALGYAVGNNQPYDARMVRGATLDRHADAVRLPNILIEYRNDQIDTPEGADIIVGQTGDFLRSLIADPACFTLYDGPEAPCDPQAVNAYFASVMRTMTPQTPPSQQEEKNAHG